MYKACWLTLESLLNNWRVANGDEITVTSVLMIMEGLVTLERDRVIDYQAGMKERHDAQTKKMAAEKTARAGNQ